MGITGEDSFENNSSSTNIISRDSNGSNSNNKNNGVKFNKIEGKGFLGESNKPDEKKIYELEDNDYLNLQIKNALKKMKFQYSVNEIFFNNELLEYYFGDYNTRNYNAIYNSNKNNNIKYNNNRYNKFSLTSK